jgi:hypothetical protein
MKLCPVACVLSDSDKFVEDLRAVSPNIYEFCENGKRTLRTSVNEIMSYFPHLSSCFHKIHYRSFFHEILEIMALQEVRLEFAGPGILATGHPFSDFLKQ